MDMKPLFYGLLLSSTIFCTACSNWRYDGEEMPPLPNDSKTAFFTDKEKVPSDFQTLGTFSFTSSAAGEKSANYRKELQKIALKNGANGILITKIRRIPAGEVRRDQLRNMQSPGWTTGDSSSSYYTHTVDSIEYSKSNPDQVKQLFKTEVEGILLRGPEIIPEKP